MKTIVGMLQVTLVALAGAIVLGESAATPDAMHQSDGGPTVTVGEVLEQISSDGGLSACALAAVVGCF